MKTSTEISSTAGFVGEEKAVELLARAGFDAWDFSMFEMCGYDWKAKTFYPTSHPLAGSDYVAFSRKLRQVGLDNGIVCNQSHAPFPTCCPEIRSYYKRALECTAEAGGEICVIHPDNLSPEENGDLYRELLPFAKQCGVKIATENMWSWSNEKNEALPAACSDPESFCAHLKNVDDDFFVACLDIGHAEMKGLHTSAVEMIEALGDKLQALHIHDNDKWHDSHRLPFTMQIDFEAVVKALKRCGYSGWFTMEADNCFADYGPDNYLSGIQNLADCARKLANMFENA